MRQFSPGLRVCSRVSSGAASCSARLCPASSSRLPARACSTPAEARRHHHHGGHRVHASFHPRGHQRHYARHAHAALSVAGGATAAIAVDGATGHMLWAMNEHAPRHPASVTKVMTLYLLFEQLEKGKMSLDDEIPISSHAAAQTPTKLGLRPGSSHPRRRRHQGGGDQVRQRHRRRHRRGHRRQRERLRRNDDAQGPCARHDAHGLSQRLRPARRRADHHGLGPRHPRARRSRRISRATTTISRLHEFAFAWPAHPQPQPSAGPGRGHGRHEDRLHRRLRLQPARLGPSRRPLPRRRGARRQDPRAPATPTCAG